jgi:UDP:flavonoid glycosyltransferase YjiC (YdhE family)
MTNPNPEEKTKILVDIVQRNRIPTIINTAAGGLVIPAVYDSDLVFFTSQIPYEWILPTVYAIIHHGGSGTTHLGLKFGCPTMIIPHIIDQHVWNRIISEKKLGPKGIKISRINTQNLEPRILDLCSNQLFKNNAVSIANKMKRESYKK